MQRTKIVCTLGPASQHTFTLRSMIRAGMNVARINFSHGTHSEHRKTIRKIRRLSTEENKSVAVLADLGGPKFRLGSVKKNTHLSEKQRVLLVNEDVVGTAKKLPINRPDLIPQLKKGHRVMIWDGKIQLEVLEPGTEEATCRVVAGGELKDRAGVNLPDTSLDIPALTAKDEKDIGFCVKEDVDFMGLSFVRSAADIDLCRDHIRSHHGQIPIVAKMEMREAVENLEEIIDATDGVMVARGDLGIEIPLEEVPLTQKRIITYANQLGKPVITATEMLLSMVTATRPTRAETGDVANAILDGSDAVMLSEETAVGKHPAAVIRTMARIAAATEESFLFDTQSKERWTVKHSPDLARAIAHSTVLLAQELDAGIIICPTDSGDTPRRVVRHRPAQIVLAISTSDSTVRRLALSWGVVPWKIPRRIPTEKIFAAMRPRILEDNLAKEGDYVVLSAGYPFGKKSSLGRLIQSEVL